MSFSFWILQTILSLSFHQLAQYPILQNENNLIHLGISLFSFQCTIEFELFIFNLTLPNLSSTTFLVYIKVYSSDGYTPFPLMYSLVEFTVVLEWPFQQSI